MLSSRDRLEKEFDKNFDDFIRSYAATSQKAYENPDNLHYQMLLQDMYQRLPVEQRAKVDKKMSQRRAKKLRTEVMATRSFERRHEWIGRKLGNLQTDVMIGTEKQREQAEHLTLSKKELIKYFCDLLTPFVFSLPLRSSTIDPRGKPRLPIPIQAA